MARFIRVLAVCLIVSGCAPNEAARGNAGPSTISVGKATISVPHSPGVRITGASLGKPGKLFVEFGDRADEQVDLSRDQLAEVEKAIDKGPKAKVNVSGMGEYEIALQKK